jgi:GNAT superfamily N-acetyltransferase
MRWCPRATPSCSAWYRLGFGQQQALAVRPPAAIHRAPARIVVRPAAVFPHARGAGAGRALGEAVIEWSAGAGYDCVVTDWRVANLLSSRTWPKLGFAESFLRPHRLVGY